MIGDFVYSKYEERVIQVREVKNFSVIYEEEFFSALDDELQPIPLTAEILEQNGFINDEIAGSWWHRQSNFEVLGNDRDGWMILSGIEIKHVHELQHALRLCGRAGFADNLKVKEG